MDAPGTLRDRKKAELRENVLRISNELFHASSFDETTLEEICAQASISKRTFFRYFRDKEALVFPNQDSRMMRFKGFLESQQTTDNPFDTLRLATRLFGTEHNQNLKRILAQQKLIRSSRALQAREREIDRNWEEILAQTLAKRSPDDSANILWARILAGAIFGIVRATMNHWFASNCKGDLTQIGLDAIERLERGFSSLKH